MSELRRRPARPVEEGEIIDEENVYDRPDETMGFFPGQILADLTVSTFLLVIVIALSYLIPVPLTEPIDITTTTYVPRPEWFFFFYDQLLMFFPGYALISFGGVVIPAIFAVVLFAVPWLDWEPGHSPMKRPFATVIALLVVAAVIFNMLLTLSRILSFPSG